MLSFGIFTYSEIYYSPQDALPQITGSGPAEIEVDILSGRMRWAQIGGSRVSVTIAASATGLGSGKGKLAPVTILGTTYDEHEDDSDSVGTSNNSTGAWEYGDNTVDASIYKHLPPDPADSYPWTAKGSTIIIPYAWQISVSEGGGVSWPFQIRGTFSTTGTWVAKEYRSITRSAPQTEGTHDVNKTYYCTACDAEGETAEAIGGKEAHDMTTCEREGCDVEYRACDRRAKALHSLCDGCNTYRCDTSTGKNHKIVTCSGQRSNGSTARSCGQEYWLCSSDAWRHKYDIGPCWGCGDYYMSCVKDDHVYHASCPKLGANGETCQSGSDGYYECQEHTCEFTEPLEIRFNKTSFKVYETLEITVTKGDLYFVSMYFDGEFKNYNISGTGSEQVLTKTFDTGDVGYQEVQLYIYYGGDDNGGNDWTSHTQYINVSE